MTVVTALAVWLIGVLTGYIVVPHLIRRLLMRRPPAPQHAEVVVHLIPAAPQYAAGGVCSACGRPTIDLRAHGKLCKGRMRT